MPSLPKRPLLLPHLAKPAPLSVAGPVAKSTVERLLLNDATRAGKRIVAVGEHGYAITSDDEGASWQRAAGMRRTMLTKLAFADDKTGWLVGHDGLIAMTSDGGATWKEQRFAPADEEPLLGVYARERCMRLPSVPTVCIWKPPMVVPPGPIGCWQRKARRTIVISMRSPPLPAASW